MLKEEEIGPCVDLWSLGMEHVLIYRCIGVSHVYSRLSIQRRQRVKLYLILNRFLIFQSIMEYNPETSNIIYPESMSDSLKVAFPLKIEFYFQSSSA